MSYHDALKHGETNVGMGMVPNKHEKHADGSPTVYAHYVMEGTQACPNPWDIEIARLSQDIVRLKELNLDLQAALLHAVTVIKQWHNMQWSIAFPTQAERITPAEVWQIYYDNAPEMKPIRDALKA